MSRFFLTLLAGLFSLADTLAQSAPAPYVAPLDIPLYLSGNFGELRNNHFHSGIDIKTEGREGVPVHSVADGYVSRISVSPSGYGNALYIAHPDGRTSVYGHLASYSEAITAYVREAQYELESFSVNLFPDKNQLRVKRGEVVALSGNSGGSGGPHLHFELRETNSQLPLNPLHYGFDVLDNIRPTISQLLVTPLSDTSLVEGASLESTYRPTASSGAGRISGVIKAYGEIGFSLNTVDQYTGYPNKCGVYEIELEKNGVPVFLQRMDTLNFSTNRYINAHMDYRRFKESWQNFHRSFQLPNNKLKIYYLSEDKGRIFVDQGDTIDFKYNVRDLSGNESSLKFRVLGDRQKQDVDLMKTSKEGYTHQAMLWDKDNEFVSPHCVVRVPDGRLYDDYDFYYREEAIPYQAISPLHRIGEKFVPLQNQINIRIACPEIDMGLVDKLLIARYDQEKDRWYAQGGTYQHGWLSSRVKEFGDYALRIDTVAPSIVNRNMQNNMQGRSDFTLNISDDLSGVDHWEARIDGKWALMHFDAKKGQLFYLFEAGRIERGNHHFEITVFDERGNQKTYQRDFVY